MPLQGIWIDRNLRSGPGSKSSKSSGIYGPKWALILKDVSHLTLVRLDLETSRANDMIELGKFCPYVINTMKMSGEENISILLAASDERRLENVIDRHYRQKPYVDRIKICRMIECGEKLVLPMDFLAETMPPGADPCDYNPICRKARAAANARTPEEINLF